MYIKKVLDYSYNYAEYIVSDGKNDIICMCISVPLSDGKIPKEGMAVSNIYIFSLNELSIQKIDKGKEYTHKNNSYFGYEIQGTVIDDKKAIISVFDFKFSLAYEYPDGLPVTFCKGDLVKIAVDRFDCEIE